MAGSPDDVQAIVQAQRQLAALEHMADRLLTALSSPGPRPLAEGAEIVADTTARLAELQAYMTQLQPTLARLEAVPQPPPAAIDALWQLEEQQQAAGGALGLDPSGGPAQSLPALLNSMNMLPGIQVLPLEARAAAGQPAAVTALRMLCGPSVAALVQLTEPGSLVPLRAAFFAPAELQAGWGSQLFGQSRHLVFQRASGVAALALRHFVSLGSGADGQPAAQAGAGASPLELLLSWLATYSDLFTRPCSATGSLLVADPDDGALLPPLFRPYRLGLQQLRAAAADPARRTAYHWQSRREEGDAA